MPTAAGQARGPSELMHLQKWHSISLVEPVAKRKTPTFVQIIELPKSIPNRDLKTIAKIDSNPRRTPCTAAGTEVGAVSKAVC